MSANPMQRKVRNSFLLGILVMLIIAIMIGVIVFFLVLKPQLDEEKQAEGQTIAVYRLKAGTSVESGEEVTSEMVESVSIPVKDSSTDFIYAKTKNSSGKVVDMYFTDGYKSKLDLSGGTILTYSMLYEGEETTDSLRYAEYNMFTMPTTLDIGTYIDIRLRLPNGQDLIVISKKEIINVYGQTVGLNLTEDEILVLNSAIIEAYAIPSSELYMTTYVEPGLQEAAKYTYSPTAEVINLIYTNENILATAKNALVERFNTSATRGSVDGQKNQFAAEATSNIAQGMQEQIQAARKAREDYLSELEGY